MKQFAGGFISRVIKLIMNKTVLFTILISTTSSFLLRNTITPLIFGGKSFTGRSFNVQALIIFAYILFFSCTCLILIKLKIRYKKQIDYLVSDGSKRLFLALIIMCVGILCHLYGN